MDGRGRPEEEEESGKSRSYKGIRSDMSFSLSLPLSGPLSLSGREELILTSLCGALSPFDLHLEYIK